MVALIYLVFGAVFGSFVAALTYRLPRGRSILVGRSECNNCHKEIAWYDNVPIVSFLLLSGRCRKCRKKISVRYPLVEASSALLFLGIYVSLGSCQSSSSFICLWSQKLGLFTPFLLGLLGLVLLAVFVIDLEERIIPDGLTFLGLGVVTFTYFFFGFENVFEFFFAAFALASFLLLTNLATKGKGMGLGDVKFALLGGLVLGLKFGLYFLFVAFLTGAAVGLILIFSGKVSFGKHIAFGPFLVFALLVVFVFGTKLAHFFPF